MSKILLLSPYPKRGTHQVNSDAGHWFYTMKNPVTRGVLETEIDDQIDLIVSHGYRHRIPPDVFQNWPCINLHISYLPWNRGADPNFWSWHDWTQQGVSIHQVDAGWDTGPIIARRHVNMSVRDETLATSYEKLQVAIVDLYREFLPRILDGNYDTLWQRADQGTYHTSAERLRIWDRFPLGWNTPVADIAKAGGHRV